MKVGKEAGSTEFIVTVKGIGQYKVPSGLNLREALRQQGIFIDGTCGDRGTCGRCMVRVLSGDPEATGGPPGPSERGMLGSGPLAEGYRMACRIVVSGNLSIEIDPERILEIDKSGRWKEVGASPLAGTDGLDLDGTGFGVALDLGTTSIAVALYDLGTGRLVDIRSAANPQLPWGEEILSRLEAAARDDVAARTMSRELWEVVRAQLRALLRRSGVSPGRVNRIVAAANSAIHHLALEMDPGSLLTPPFDPATVKPLSFPAGEAPFELPAGHATTIDFLPLIGGFAGSDCLAAVMAARKAGSTTGAVIDVGTNTEIAAWRDEKVIVATAPSGPAFEGGHIRFGMRAEEGAIFKVELGRDSVRCEVIGGGEPRGICGTGIVDAVAGMLSRQLVDRSGLVVKGGHRAMDGGNLVLDHAAGVLLEPADIETLQKAKAAIAATFLAVLGALEVDPVMLEKVYLAGAFGSRLNIGNAVSIGLLPELPPEHLEHDRYVLAGNAAMTGAAMVLLSGDAGKAAAKLAPDMVHLDVANDPGFQELFLENLYFPDNEIS